MLDQLVDTFGRPDVRCPFCTESLAAAKVLTAADDSSRISLECPRCYRKANLGRLLWVSRGLKVYPDVDLRCPFCNKLFAYGDYSDRPQQVKCRSCGNISFFIRVTAHDPDKTEHGLTAFQNEAIGAPIVERQEVSEDG